MKKFAFLIHPRTIDDVYRRLGVIIGIGEVLGMKILPLILPGFIITWILPRLNGRFGFTVCSKFKVDDNTEGYIIAVLLTAEQMATLPPRYVQGRIVDTVLFSQNELGVDRVGLGAYTAPMTLNGKIVAKDKRVKCKITHGDALSAATAVPAAVEGAKIKNINIADSTIAVVGAYGIVGRGASKLLSELNPQKMILTGPNVNKLAKLKEEIAQSYFGKIVVSSSNDVMQSADIVVLSTTGRGDIVTDQSLKRNCVVVDMAQPHNMSEQVSRKRPDILRIDGGFIKLSNVDYGFDWGTPKGVAFACFTETMLSTLTGDEENHVGLVDVEFAKKISLKAKTFGHYLAPLTSFSRPLNEDDCRRSSAIRVPTWVSSLML